MLRRTPALLVALAALLSVLLGAQGCSVSTSGSSTTSYSTAQAGGATDPDSGLPYIDVSDLPSQAQATLRLIEKGGPFPYSKDGSHFGNYEGLLPDHSGDYYKEYTVDTPGSEDRGARRLIVGDHDETYYTSDHYSSFDRVRR